MAWEVIDKNFATTFFLKGGNKTLKIRESCQLFRFFMTTFFSKIQYQVGAEIIAKKFYEAINFNNFLRFTITKYCFIKSLVRIPAPR